MGKKKKPITERDEDIQIQVGFGVRPEFDPEAIDETAAAALRAKQEAEATRTFVCEGDNYRRLIGCTIPVEILRIQNLPSHNCLIIDDHLLLSYVEAKELLEQLEEQG